MENNNSIQNRFKVTFADPNLKILEDRITSLTIPGLSLRFTQIPTPIRPIFRPGERVDVLDMSLTVILDEDLIVWRNICEWILKNKNQSELKLGNIVTDCTITVLNNKYNKVMELELIDVFPYSLSDLPMVINIQDANPTTIDIIFKVDQMNIV